MMAILLILTMVFIPVRQKPADAKSKSKTYYFFAWDVTMFKKTGSRLKVASKTEYWTSALSSTGKKIKTFKLAKKCKWKHWKKKYSYKKLRDYVYGNPDHLIKGSACYFIFRVKNGKLVEVRLEDQFHEPAS